MIENVIVIETSKSQHRWRIKRKSIANLKQQLKMSTKCWINVCDKRKSSQTKLQTAKSINWLQINDLHQNKEEMRKKCSAEYRAGIWSWTQWVARIYSDILFNFVHFITFDENIRKHSTRQAIRLKKKTKKKVKIKRKFLSKKIEQLNNWTWVKKMGNEKRKTCSKIIIEWYLNVTV